jgi:hypothetical protein
MAMDLLNADRELTRNAYDDAKDSGYHGLAARLDIDARIEHRPFPGGRELRTPALVLGMAWYRLRDLMA